MFYFPLENFVQAVARYAAAINRTLKTGDATEHSHRAALERFLSELSPTASIVNEPQRKTGYGAPDLLVTKGGLPIGYVETKDIGDNLNKTEKSDQLVRYREGLSNLLLTDYCEFRRYLDGEPAGAITLLARDKKGQWTPNAEAMDAAILFFGQFLDHEGEMIGRAKILAQRLAGLTRLMRHTVAQALEYEKRQARVNNLRLVSMPFHEQLDGFREVLIHDLAEHDFADIYAQTIAYGFFTARFHKKDAQAFTRERAAFLIPQNNEFLARTFARICGADVQHGLDWALDDLAALLDRTDMDAILSEFRGPTAAKAGWRVDPVYYFYEDFLAEYNPKLREARGVYYTPGPVVDYIVRSVDKILMRDFGLKDGLADKEKIPIGGGEYTHRLHILDPAAGTGTFFHHIIDHLYHGRFANTHGAWPQYVKDHLLPRLHGFEFLMAPYAIAHLKLALQLQDQGVRLDRGDRINIILTNTLEEAKDLDSPPMFTRWLVDEAKRANRVKMQTPVMAIMGNPPYSGHSENKGAWISQLVDDYKRDYPDLRKPGQGKWLNDDYVKFIRFAQWRIERTGHGVLGFITNHAYLDNPTFRGMRHSLMKTFDEIYVLDLHGNAKKKERAPDGGEDKNVFDIQQGVAIALFIKRQSAAQKEATHKPPAKLARAFHADLWGPREVWDNRGKNGTLIGGKYAWLSDHDVTNTDWTELNPEEPQYLFVPRNNDQKETYSSFFSLPNIFSLNGDPAPGIVTTHDDFAISWSRDEAVRKVERLLATKTENEARAIFKLCSQDQWQYARAKLELKDGAWREEVAPILYRPFDLRWTVYNRNVAVHRRERVMRHMLRENIAIATCRQKSTPGEWAQVSITNKITESCCISNKTKEINTIYPLYIYPEETKRKKDLFDNDAGDARGMRDAQGRIINLAPAYITALASATGLTFDPNAAPLSSSRASETSVAIHETHGLPRRGPSPAPRNDKSSIFGPRDVMAWIYAVLHTPAYRARYAEFLRSDFPRIPTPRDADQFVRAVLAGHRLMALHLMEEHGEVTLTFPIQGDNIVDKPRYADGRVYINKTQYFDGVDKAVWEHSIGGYQVMDKWLKDRKGRTLSYDDVLHYQRIAAILSETREIMAGLNDAWT